MARETRRDDDFEPAGRDDDRRRTHLDPPDAGRITRRDDQAGADRAGPAQGGHARPGDDGYDPTFKWPDELANDWELVRRLKEGGESALYLVRGRHADNRGERVIKIYERRVRRRDAVIQRVARFDPRHVVRMYDHFQLGSRWVEILEYIEAGSLEDLVEKQKPPLPQPFVRDLVEQLHGALSHIHAAEIVHRDIKPGNILLRTRDPLDTVLTDFGIASYLDSSTYHLTSAHRTELYASPEALDGKIQTASDWWSVGILLVEMLTGHHPFARTSGAGHLTTREIEERLVNQDVEEFVANVPEPFLQLCRGLLRRDVDNRWDGAKVRRWLDWRDGEEPLSVRAEAPPGRPAFEFSGTQRRHYTLSDVARALSDHWSEGVAAYGRGDLQRWLLQVCEGALLAEVQRIDGEWAGGDYDLHQALYRTIIAIDPTIVPSFRGFRLDEPGLRRLAEEASERDAHAMEVLRGVGEGGCLSTYASMRGSEWHARTEELWHRQIQAYVRLARLVPEDLRYQLEGNLPLAIAAGLRASLSSEGAWEQALRQRAMAQRLASRHIPTWYAQLQAIIPNAAVAVLIGIGSLRPQAAEAAATEEQRRREARDVFFGAARSGLRIAAIVAVLLLAAAGVASLLNLV